MNDDTTPNQPHGTSPESGAWWAGSDGRTSRGPQPPYATGPSGLGYGPAAGTPQPPAYGPTGPDYQRPYTAPAGATPELLTPSVPGPAPVRGASWARRTAAAAVIAVVALAGGTAGALITHATDDGDSTAAAAPAFASTSAAAATTAPTQSLAQVAAKVTPSVVSVSFTSDSGAGEGSGVILTADGQILTNNHVVAAVANGGTLTVKFSDGKSAKARILGRDPSTDLAVIRAEGVSGLTPATLGSSSSLHVGDTVLAIGNPLGLEGSVSAGIVSALHRSVDIPAEEEQQSPQQMFPGLGSQSQPQSQSSSSGGTVLKNAIQTDAAVNPGNSGGALVDAAGRVVGINSAIASLSSGSGESGSIGVGFAIPIDTAKVIAAQLAKGETVRHPLLGVSISDSTDGSSGALVGSVSAGSGAAAAGIAKGDVITSVGGQAVNDADGLQAVISGHQPGDKVEVVYTRGGSSHTVTVTLGASAS
ncbi:putative serine protease PepD [Motilibacter peucedani]|uniref:Putative serine protease PepD n=1 Tax=Motilibacter peucedani TaxID=598650 RepID=A0A420XQ16_9ACTN|nr:trypsin-like peptidase domain-containing protein [Motilibacter peucedani]RKS75378.1 putative serine protease PepD [Motilibacter peucedani]